MRWGAVRFIAVMLALAVLSREAVAEMAAFGAARHLVLSGSIFGQYYHGAGSGGTGAATIAVAPNLHWFGIENVSLGAYLALTYQNDGNQGVTGYALTPAVGYNLTLGEKVSLWPQLLVSIASSGTSSGPSTSSITRWGVGAYFPFIYRPSEPLFFGFGPNFLTDLSAKSSDAYYGVAKVTSIGVQSMIGAWF